MPGRRSGPVACFSYLAAAELWKVTRFPPANHGAEVLSIEHSVAADAPMTAAVLAALGLPALLLANDIGTDPGGTAVLGWLQRHKVSTTAGITAGTVTPRIIVVADNAGSRTWFPYLPGVVDALARLDLEAVKEAALVYVDCYQLIETAAIRVVLAARAAGAELFVNLGGSPLSASLTTALRGYGHLVVQTNVDDADHQNACSLATELLAATGADWVVVTAGAAGAVAVSAAGCLKVPAFEARVRHTHCAGAAFSGGFLYGLLHDWPMIDSLRLASASGALRCERAHGEPMPSLAELHEVIGSREQLRVSAS